MFKSGYQLRDLFADWLFQWVLTFIYVDLCFSICFIDLTVVMKIDSFILVLSYCCFGWSRKWPLNSLELVPASRQSSQLEGRLEDFEQQFVGGCAALVQGFLGEGLGKSYTYIYIYGMMTGVSPCMETPIFSPMKSLWKSLAKVLVKWWWKMMVNDA